MQNFIIARFCSPRNEPPLAASDGVHTFTYDSVQRRLPLIAEAIIENNPDYPQPLVTSLRTLAGEIAAGEPLRALEAAPDSWESELVPCLAESQTWFTAPWFLVENYFYKRILELTSAATGSADPFAAQKAASLRAASGDEFRAFPSHATTACLSARHPQRGRETFGPDPTSNSSHCACW